MNSRTITVLGLCGRSVFMRVDHFHRPGETLHAETVYVEPGGKGYNQAVAAARLGAKVNFLTACGDDEDGRACTRFLLQEGIAPYTQTVDKPTAFACILTERNGANRVTVCRGAADSLSAEFVLSHEDVFRHSDAVLLNFEVPEEANEAAVKLAEKYGVRVILNPAPAHPCTAEYLSRFYCVTPNESEAEILGGRACREIVTLGEKGARVTENGEEYLLPAVPVQVKDTTGAGDCFNAALTVALCEGKTLREAVEFAQKAAAISVSRDFVMPSLPYRNEIK